jgi:hypothetical protein
MEGKKRKRMPIVELDASERRHPQWMELRNVYLVDCMHNNEQTVNKISLRSPLSHWIPRVCQLKNLGSIHFRNPISSNPATKRNPKHKTSSMMFISKPYLSQICNISRALNSQVHSSPTYADEELKGKKGGRGCEKKGGRGAI